MKNLPVRQIKCTWVIINAFAIILCLLFANILNGQGYWQWANSVQGSAFDYFGKVRTDPSGNVFASGGFESSTITIGTTTLTNNGGLDIFLAKYDPSGNAIWAKAVNPTQTTSQQNEVFDMATDALGNMYICGYFQAPSISFDTNTLTNTGSYNAFVVKYDPSGNVLWARKAGGSGNNYDIMSGISVDNAGNVLVCGWYSSSDFKIGSISLPKNGDNDSYLAKYDSSGNIIWAKHVSSGSAHSDQLNGIGADANGNVYVSGYSTDSAGTANITVNFSATVQTTVTPDNIYLARYDPNGNALWAVHSTGADNSSNGGRTANNAVAVDAAGNSYLTGPYDNPIQFGNLTPLTFTRDPVLTSANVYVAKYDSSGNAIWANSSGISPYCSGFDIVVDGSGSCYATGFYQRGSGGGPATISFGNTTLTTSGIQSAFIVKYSSNGTVALALTPTGPSNITVIGGDGVGVDASGNIFAAGSYVNSSATFGNITLTNNGQYDGYIAKYNSGTASNPIANFTASNTTICEGRTVHFTDQSTGSPTNWKWTFNGGTPVNSNSQNPTVTYDTVGTFSVKLVVSNSSGTDSITKTSYITIVASPVAGTVSALPDSMCTGNSSQLMATGSSGSLQWQSSPTGNNFSNTGGADSSHYTTPPLTQTTYYRLIAANGICADTSPAITVMVNPNPAPPVLSTNDSIICANDSALIHTSGSYSSYLWNDGDTTNYTYAKQAGGYWVTVTNANGCKAVSDANTPPLNISVYPVPSVSIIEQGDTLSSYNESGYQWYYNNNPVNGDTLPFYIALQAGSYSVQVTDSNGCKALSNEVTITGVNDLNEAKMGVYPNPSLNGNWQLQVDNDLVGGKLEIYDDNGRLVFTSEIKDTKSEISFNAQRGIYLLRINTPTANFISRLVRL